MGYRATEELQTIELYSVGIVALLENIGYNLHYIDYKNLIRMKKSHRRFFSVKNLVTNQKGGSNNE